MDNFKEAINQVIYESQEKAISDLVDDMDLDSIISKHVKANLISKIAYGMNLKSLEVYRDLNKNEEVLVFKVSLRKGDL